MTIAAGFAFDDGILFCVDTKVTTGIKTNEPKLIFYRHAGGKCATAFAMSSDDLTFPRSAIESCREAVDKVNFANASIESVKKAIQSALAKFYREHIFPHPDRNTGAIYLELLVGIWLHGDTRLFVSHETLLTPIEDYECVGSGAFLAKYLVRQYQSANPDPLTLEDAALIGSYAVERVMEHDEYSGGEADMLILKNNGDVESSHETAIYPGDDLVKAIQGSTWNLLRALAHIKGDLEAESGELLERYFEKVRNLNAQSKWWFEKWAELSKSRSKPTDD